MKTLSWLLITAAVTFLLIPRAVAEECDPYQEPYQCCSPYCDDVWMDAYTVFWVDDDGWAIALNFTEDASYCDHEPIAYSNVTLTMPGGYSVYAEAWGYYGAAEAIAIADASYEDGNGSISGNNQVTYTCGALFWWISFPIQIRGAVTVSTTATQDPGTGCDSFPCSNPAKCNQVNSCTPETSPPTCSVNGRKVIEFAQLCPPAYESGFIVWKISAGSWNCVSKGRTSTPYFGQIPGNCTNCPSQYYGDHGGYVRWGAESSYL